MTEKQSFKLVATTMDIPKTRLKDTIPILRYPVSARHYNKILILFEKCVHPSIAYILSSS